MFFEQIRANQRKSILLLAITFVILYLFINLIAAAVGGYTRDAACTGYYRECGIEFYWNFVTMGITAGAVALYLLVAYLSSARAALALTHAHPATGTQYAQLRNLVEGVSIAAGIPAPAVYVINDPAPNAFATGLKPEKAAVAVTTGLMARMSRRELEGVIAHEVAHIRNRDTSFMTLVVLTVGAIAVISTILVRIGLVASHFIGSGSTSRRNRDANGAAALIALAFLAIGLIGFILALPVAALIKAALSRRRETMADASAVELTRNPSGIRSALEKLEADTAVVRHLSTTTAHLWIESPLERKQHTGFAGSVGRLFDSHPPLAERIAILRTYEGLDPAGRGPNDPGPGDAGAGMAGTGPVSGSEMPPPPPGAAASGSLPPPNLSPDA